MGAVLHYRQERRSVTGRRPRPQSAEASRAEKRKPDADPALLRFPAALKMMGGLCYYYDVFIINKYTF